MSLTEILSGTPDIQKDPESRDAMNARGDARDVQMDEDSALDKEGDGYAAAESQFHRAQRQIRIGVSLERL